MMDLQQQLEALPWWMRPINQTSYHCDDLAKMCLAAITMVTVKNSYLTADQLSPLNVWFTEYNPSKQAHDKAPIWNSRSALVKTSRYSDDNIVMFTTEHGPPQDVWLGRWFRERYIPREESGRYNHYQMVGIATPTARHFDREDPTETIRMGQGHAPSELIRQVVWYTVLRMMGASFKGGVSSFSHYRWEEIENKWKELAPQLSLRFDRSYRPKKYILDIRQRMAANMEKTYLSKQSVESHQERVARDSTDLKNSIDRLRTEEKTHQENCTSVSKYLLSLGQEKPKSVANATPTAEKEEKKDA